MENEHLAPYITKVLSKFKDLRRGKNGWKAHCPCGDHGRSIQITLGYKGRILLKCWSRCTKDRILEAAGLTWRDLFNPQQSSEVGPEPKASAVSPKDSDFLHRAYECLLETLCLSENHRDQLRERGMPDDHVRRGQYRSLRNVERGRAAQHVHSQLGRDVLNVPGFVEGPFGITLAGTSTGLLIPVRNTEGRIQALKIRRSGDPKYVYLTGSEGSNSSGSPVHVPLGLKGPAETVRVTEGELKSDIAFRLDGTPTIGIPGVTQWKKAFPVLRQLKAETVLIAFDAVDVRSKPAVFMELHEFWQSLKDEGYSVEIEDWDGDS